MPRWRTAMPRTDPLVSLRGVLFGWSFDGLIHCVRPSRVSPRRASNFHLSRQMKVTKAKAPNASHLIPPLRLEKIIIFGRADYASEHHAAGPAVVNSNASPQHTAHQRVHPHFKNPVPAAWRAEVPSDASKAMIFSARSVGIKWLAFEPLCFGDFHLGQQMKVTRPPGRDPAGPHAVEKPIERTNHERPSGQDPEATYVV